ncbi:MAG: MoaD/ThiS family protein [Proteobacteria bacterium]|nr:MoaD/ThiS family protein [Pseudomonadota bacterium]
MIVRIKLYASLDKYLPDGASRNQADMEFDQGARVSSVLGQLGLPPESCHLVLVNGVFLAPSEREARVLEDGDHLAVWPPVAGGAPKTKVVEKEMALTHGDFLRTLPKALGTGNYRKNRCQSDSYRRRKAPRDHARARAHPPNRPAIRPRHRRQAGIFRLHRGRGRRRAEALRSHVPERRRVGGGFPGHGCIMSVQPASMRSATRRRWK